MQYGQNAEFLQRYRGHQKIADLQLVQISLQEVAGSPQAAEEVSLS